ncbi:MAG: DUF1501 domain-containing protein [Planctomycetaceae bacterium]
MQITRRNFLKGGLALPAAAALPAFFARAVFGSPPGERVLVLVQLAGGNDGLSMVVPFEEDAYHRARPSLGLRGGQVVPLRDGIGLHGNLGKLRGSWDAGQLAVVQGVGYPNPNRSHFLSTDIWHTASLTPPSRWNGWVGRALDRCCGDGAEVPGLQLGGQPLSLALVGERIMVPAVRDANSFHVQGGAKSARLLASLVEAGEGGGEAEYVRRSAKRAYATAARLEKALTGGRAADVYPGTPLGQQLWQVARLVESGLPARVYAVTLDGFDTHSRQKQQHDNLMRALGDALGAFRDDLVEQGLFDRVLVMTYSEFGRRVEENRSLGTDHGAAAPLFLMGGKVKGGLCGAHPALTDLEQGDLKHHTDFRSVYATVLEGWFGLDPAVVLGAEFPRVAALA